MLSSQNIYQLSGIASGAQESTPNLSSGTATLTGTYNQTTGMITVNIPFSGLGSGTTASHIHGPAGIGMNAPVILNLMPPTAVTSGTIAGTFPFPLASEAALLSGNTYLNIHTSGFPGGEIRAQITATLIAVPTMGEWGLIILGLSLVIVGVVVALAYKKKLIFS